MGGSGEGWVGMVSGCKIIEGGLLVGGMIGYDSV